MKPDHLNELAASNAVGALKSDESEQFHDSLATADEQTKAGIIQLQDDAALFAVAQSSERNPSASLKGKILAQVQASAVSFPKPFFFVERNEGQWQTLPIPGVRAKDLSADSRLGMSVKLYELAAGARFPNHHHSGPEECYVVCGDFHVEDRVLHGGDFHHAESNSDHGESFSENGCTLLVIVGTDDYK